MKNVSEKKAVEKIETHFMFNTFFFENRAVYEITRENIVQWAGHRLRYGACAANTRASVLRYTYIACLVLDTNHTKSG